MVNAIDTSISSEIVNYINEHFKELSLTSMAKAFNYHPDYLGKIIKKMTGSSLTTLVKERKLDYAGYLLEHTQMPVSDVVAEIGYSNTSYFYKQFKKNSVQRRTKYVKIRRNPRNLEDFFFLAKTQNKQG